MSNVYTISYCPKCKTMHTGSTMIVHGSYGLEKLSQVISEGKSVEEIYNSFCSYCGGFIEGDECSCGNTRRQKYSDE